MKKVKLKQIETEYPISIILYGIGAIFNLFLMTISNINNFIASVISCGVCAIIMAMLYCFERYLG